MKSYQNYELDETKTSKFNAALFKMQRLHEIMDKMNKLDQFPLGVDDMTGEENYRLLCRCCDALFLEAYAKLNKKDREIGDKVKITLGRYIELYPVRVQLKKNGSTRGRVVFKKENWEKISKALFIYEKLVRDFIDKTGMDSPEEDENYGY